jgi:CysZ protein
MEGTPPVAPATPDVSPPAPQPAAVAAPAKDPRAELAAKALVPLVPGAPPRCPRCGIRLLTDAEKKSCPRCKVDPASPEAAANLVPVGMPWKEFFYGAAYMPRGFFKILVSPRLWPAAAIPLILNIIIFACVAVGGIWLLNHALTPLASPDALPDWNGWWVIPKYIIKFLGMAVGYLSWAMIPLLTAWLMGAFPFSLLLRAMFTPFATMVSERTEQVMLGLETAKQPLSVAFADLYTSITVALVNTILLALLEGVLYLVLLPLALLPPIWMVLPPTIMAGMDHTDPTFCRKSYWMRERVALWKARKWRFLGFGVTFFFLLGIPFLNAVIFPVAACGAAILYLELDRK